MCIKIIGVWIDHCVTQSFYTVMHEHHLCQLTSIERIVNIEVWINEQVFTWSEAVCDEPGEVKESHSALLDY